MVLNKFKGDLSYEKSKNGSNYLIQIYKRQKT